MYVLRNKQIELNWIEYNWCHLSSAPMKYTGDLKNI